MNALKNNRFVNNPFQRRGFELPL